MKEKKSEFQFANPLLLNMEFSINTEYEFTDLGYDVIKPKFSLNISSEEEMGVNNKRVVRLNIEIGYGQDDEKIETPFYLNMEIASIFKWGDSIKDEEQIENLLNINAPALLLSYARPIISNITQQSGLLAYNIPFINFTGKN